MKLTPPKKPSVVRVDVPDDDEDEPAQKTFVSFFGKKDKPAKPAKKRFVLIPPNKMVNFPERCRLEDVPEEELYAVELATPQGSKIRAMYGYEFKYGKTRQYKVARYLPVEHKKMKDAHYTTLKENHWIEVMYPDGFVTHIQPVQFFRKNAQQRELNLSMGWEA